MQFIWGSVREPELNDALAHWAAQKIGVDGFQRPYSTMGVFSGEKLIAVEVFNNWHPEAGVIEMHGAATDKRWLTRPCLWEQFSYVFNQLNCQMVVMRVSEGDKPLHRILHSYGFKSHFIPRLRGRNEGEYIFTLTEEDWRANGFHKENA